ncbi:MAG TPA: lysophospholipid acyltransferase family protein [Phototrophicaceae bacterium]|nr:lysophospholipid acyltransferase family protein [Phototrophicaceae bacterium]
MAVPTRPAEVPLVLSLIARWLFRLFGWRVEGTVPNFPKFIIVAAPHTSNWDGVILIFVALILRMKIYWMGKHTLFKPPLGWFLRALGGIPIDRRASHNAVQQAVAQFAEHERLILVIPPEGTRRKAARWKTGFYYIAQGANVPLVLGYIDFPRKVTGLGPVLQPSGDIEADMEPIRAFYQGKTGLHPERMGEITLG